MSEKLDRVSICLRELEAGDEGAVERLIPLLYDDLRALAARIQGSRARYGSMNPTALVHEAYARLAQHAGAGFESRRHFMRVAALAMRQLLADRAREQRAAKRGGNALRVTLSTDAAVDEGTSHDLVAIDEALTRLAATYPRAAKVVELRFFAGLSVDETAEILAISPRTAGVDWQLARAWLGRELGESEGDSGTPE